MKLNIGCGNDLKKGWVNCDMLPPYDRVIDIEKRLLFKDNSIEEIYCKYTLEHISNPYPIIDEFHRILKPNGKLTIIVPHHSHDIAYIPTHKSFYNYRCLDCFDINLKDTGSNSEVRYTKKFRMKKTINPTIYGKIIPPFLRNFVSLFIGNMVMDMTFEMVKYETPNNRT